MAEARDVDLAEWLNAAGFHPANNRLKQLGHEAARNLLAEVGTALWQLLPPSREKSIVFASLEKARWAANQALAVHGGPREHVTEEHLTTLLSMLNPGLPKDPRISEYEAEQRGDQQPGPLDALPFPVPDVVREQAERPAPTVDKHDPAEPDHG